VKLKLLLKNEITTEVSVRPEWKWKSCVIATCVVKLCIKFTILKRVDDWQVHSVFSLTSDFHFSHIVRRGLVVFIYY